ncbi:MAG TPA: hypothetical protein VK904_03130 [Miltoncostaeaceae bacterium]|nr:hypothetical protein [Miltoncostaeaceae bacterium]
MSWVNAVEVSDRTERDHGRAEADEVMRVLRSPFELDLPGPALMVEAARLKSERAIGVADGFAVATRRSTAFPS